VPGSIILRQEILNGYIRRLQLSKLSEADLMPFQVEGRDRILAQARVYLGDDPGLGKTAQIICALKHMPKAVLDMGVLIIVPASLRLNWHKEWKLWGGPDCEKYIISYNEATNDAQGKAPRKGAERIGVGTRTWGFVAFDEAHALKGGGKSQRSFALVKNCKQVKVMKMVQGQEVEVKRFVHSIGVKALRIVMMSGTPMLNKPSDMFLMLRHLDPKNWSSKQHYELHYCDAGFDDWGRWQANGLSNAAELKDRLINGDNGAPGLVLRRMKKDVLKQLPAKRRQIVEIELGVRARGKISKILLAGAGMEKKLTDSDADMKYAVKLMEAFDVSHGLPGHVAEMRRELGISKIKPVLEALIEQHQLGILPKKLVLFAHHREVIEKIAEGLRAKGIKAQEYYGGMNDTKKNDVVEAFQTGDLQIFVGSIMAAGVGLTLTAASTAMIVEPSYVPAENTQAEDRIHRIGALHPVLIQYIVVGNTLDSRIMDLVINKMEMISMVLA